MRAWRSSRRSPRSAGGARNARRSRRRRRARRSIGAEISPVNAPSGSQCTFCAATAISVPARIWTATPSEVNGGQTATSTPSRSASARFSSTQNSAVSAWPLYIFQLPAISTSSPPGLPRLPGNSFPSRSSRAAPPPVEAQSTRSSSPSSVSARIESAPPTTVYPSASATASATAFVPSAKRGHSKTPIGPFQKMVFAPAILRGEGLARSRGRCRARASRPAARRRARPSPRRPR